MEEGQSHRGAALFWLLHPTLKANVLPWSATLQRESRAITQVTWSLWTVKPGNRAALLLPTPFPSARGFVYTDFSKYSPGMLFQELGNHYSLRFVFWSNFTEYSFSVNTKYKCLLLHGGCQTPEGVKALHQQRWSTCLVFKRLPWKTEMGKSICSFKKFFKVYFGHTKLFIW